MLYPGVGHNNGSAVRTNPWGHGKGDTVRFHYVRGKRRAIWLGTLGDAQSESESGREM